MGATDILILAHNGSGLNVDEMRSMNTIEL